MLMGLTMEIFLLSRLHFILARTADPHDGLYAGLMRIWRQRGKRGKQPEPLKECHRRTETIRAYGEGFPLAHSWPKIKKRWILWRFHRFFKQIQPD